MPGTILPIGRRIFRTEDEGDAFIHRAERGHAATSAAAGLIQRLHLSGYDVRALDPRAVKDAPGEIAADVVNDPLTVGGPDIGVRQDVVVRRMRELTFHVTIV